MNKLIVSLSPHVHGGDSVKKNMYGVLIALIPAFLVSLYFFGLGALIVTATSVSSFAFFEVSAASPGVDHTGEDLAAVLAPNHVSHNFVCPAILCLYLLQWAGGFLLHQFKFPLRHQLLNVSNTGQIVLWGVKFSPCLNVSAVLAHSGRLLTQIPAGISLFILCDFFRSAGAAWIRSGSPSRTPHRACPPHSQTPYPTGFGPDTSWACRSEDR